MKKISSLTVIFLFAFMLYVMWRENSQEGMMNNKPSPVVVDESNPDYIFNKLTDPNDDLYDPNFSLLTREEIIADMQYFNNATNILYNMQNPKLP
jgi:flagellar basal body-associated protein FliL